MRYYLTRLVQAPSITGGTHWASAVEVALRGSPATSVRVLMNTPAAGGWALAVARTPAYPGASADVVPLPDLSLDASIPLAARLALFASIGALGVDTSGLGTRLRDIVRALGQRAWAQFDEAAFTVEA